MEEKYLERVFITTILVVLLIASFFILKPILFPVVIGLIFAFIFTPLYKLILKKFNYPNIVAGLICLLLMVVISLPVVFFSSDIINQSISIYIKAQAIDFVSLLKKIFPSVFSTESFAHEIGSIIQSFITKVANSIMNFLSSIILNFPSLFLKFIVVIFTFFFALRDGDDLVNYLKSLLPFPKETKKKIFDASRDITNSVIYGQVVLGIVQGIFVGIGFLIFKIPNSLFLALLAVIAGIFPIVGTTVIWFPVAVYLLIAAKPLSALGITFFGLGAVVIDNFLKPVLVSRRTTLKSSIILIGMVGGFFLFGVIGFVLGPLILAYLLIILELYRKKPIQSVFIKDKSDNYKK